MSSGLSGLSGLSAMTGSPYAMRDDFTTNRSAGAVNGTAIDGIGAGTRTVNDPSSNLSIAGGKATFASGGAAYGNPGLWFPSHNRSVGKTLIWEFNISTLATKIVAFGWDTDQTSTTVGGGLVLNGTTDMRALDGGGNQIIVGAGLAAATSYRGIAVMHSTGMDIMIQGGAYTYPTLLYVTITGTTATLYPVLSNFSATYTSDFIEVLSSGWVVPVIASDGFGSTFGTTDGLGHTDNTGIGAGGNGITWTQRVGTWQTSAGRASASALSGGLAIATVPGVTKDVFLSTTFIRSAGVGGLCARYTDSSNYVIAYHDGTNAKLDQVVSGVTTNKISAAATFVSGGAIQVVLDGNSARMWYAGAHVGATTSLDAGLTATAHGIYTTDTGNTLDNFSVKARGTGNEYAVLSNFF